MDFERLQSIIGAYNKLLGYVSDMEIAANTGLTVKEVAFYREYLGIPANAGAEALSSTTWKKKPKIKRDFVREWHDRHPEGAFAFMARIGEKEVYVIARSMPTAVRTVLETFGEPPSLIEPVGPVY